MPKSLAQLEQELSKVADPLRRVEIILAAAGKLADTEIADALAFCEKAVAVAEQAEAADQPIPAAQATVFHLQGTLFLNHANYSLALVSFTKAKTIHENLVDSDAAAVEVCFIGIAQAYAGLYADALQNLRAALSVFEAQDDPVMIARSLNSIGHIYVQLDESEK